MSAAARHAPLQVKPEAQRIPLTDRERAEAATLIAAFASGNSTSAEKGRLAELSRIAFVNGDTLPGAPTGPVEIWIRKKGTRRQAYFRTGGTGTWRDMQVTYADKALRDGRVTIGGAVNAQVVSRETRDEVEHPAAAGFAMQAKALNREISSINAAGAMA